MSTLRTEKQRDRNYLSLGPDALTFYAGTTMEESFWYSEKEIPKELMPVLPKDWESILKCSNCHDKTLTDLRVAQGKENALDINNKSFNLSLQGSWGVVGDEGEQVIIAKGGSHSVQVGGIVYSRGRRADLIFGLWSDQSFDPSRHLDFSGLRHISGRPLTVILCRVDNPWSAIRGKPLNIKLPPKAKILFWKSLVAIVGWWIKWAAVKVGLIKSVKQV